jgi:membrane protein YdbS with pleckstrin-like domain
LLATKASCAAWLNFTLQYLTTFVVMLDQKEKLFVEYWELNREKEKSLLYQVLTGLPIGLLFALPIIFILFTGRYWFKRADMVANAELNPVLLVSAVLIIATFVAVLYKRHQWEMKEQQYKELKVKEKRKS